MSTKKHSPAKDQERKGKGKSADLSNKKNGKRKAEDPIADCKDIDDLFDDLKKAKKHAAEEKAAEEEARLEEKRKAKAAKLAAKKAEEGRSNAQPGSYIDSTNKAQKKRAHGVCQPGDPSYIISPDPPVHRVDAASGLPVYKAHLLKVGEGGGTPLCPFDCDCCF
jgi:hypothetical protein